MSVTTFLMGGCANQMFQYAAGYSIAKRYNVPLVLDVSRFSQDNEFRMYSLSLFPNIKNSLVHHRFGHVVNEHALPFDEVLLGQAVPPCTLVGYWQCERYFERCREDLTELFAPGPLPASSLKTLQLIESEGAKSVFLTIRRTDYVNTPYHGVLPQEYYEKAAAIIAAKVDDPCFFIFTDDVEWCVKNFRLPYRTAIAGNFDRTEKPHLGREDAELYLMQRCQHAIMANSSYSWWGVWLGRADLGGIVIAPSRWFGDPGADSRDICPFRWIKI